MVAYNKTEEDCIKEISCKRALEFLKAIHDATPQLFQLLIDQGLLWLPVPGMVESFVKDLLHRMDSVPFTSTSGKQYIVPSWLYCRLTDIVERFAKGETNTDLFDVPFWLDFAGDQSEAAYSWFQRQISNKSIRCESDDSGYFAHFYSDTPGDKRVLTFKGKLNGETIEVTRVLSRGPSIVPLHYYLLTHWAADIHQKHPETTQPTPEGGIAFLEKLWERLISFNPTTGKSEGYGVHMVWEYYKRVFHKVPEQQPTAPPSMQQPTATPSQAAFGPPFSPPPSHAGTTSNAFTPVPASVPTAGGMMSPQQALAGLFQTMRLRAANLEAQIANLDAQAHLLPQQNRAKLIGQHNETMQFLKWSEIPLKSRQTKFGGPPKNNVSAPGVAGVGLVPPTAHAPAPIGGPSLVPPPPFVGGNPAPSSAGGTGFASGTPGGHGGFGNGGTGGANNAGFGNGGTGGANNDGYGNGGTGGANNAGYGNGGTRGGFSFLNQK